MSDPTREIGKSYSPTDSYSTVKFNVGGRHYEVSRASIEKFPSTMLARMISETWQKDPEVTLFIDRDSDRFRFCLDYMRDGQVCLPHNVPKEGILLELDYFGFEEVDTTKIHGGSSNWAAARHLIKCKEEHEKVLSTCTEDIKAAKTTYTENVKAIETTSKCEEVAYECFLRFSQGKSLVMSFFHSNDSVCFRSAMDALDNPAKFQDHLAKYGLALVEGMNTKGSSVCTLKLKETEDTINYGLCCDDNETNMFCSAVCKEAGR
jgi:hypothetical protein